MPLYYVCVYITHVFTICDSWMEKEKKKKKKLKESTREFLLFKTIVNLYIVNIKMY